jgi:hypothetical protein
MIQLPTVRPGASTSLVTTQVAQPSYEITDADKARIAIIQAAWKAYHGQLDEPLTKMNGQPNDNVMSNRCQPPVDRGADFLFGKPVEIMIERGGNETMQAFLDKTWGKTEARLPLLQKFSKSGGVAGQAFLRVMPEKNNTFRLIVVDPSTISVQTAAQDCETVELYCIEYSTTEKINNKDATVYYREEIVRIDPDNDGDDGDPFADVDATWEIRHWKRIGDRGNWAEIGGMIKWEYNFPPLFSNQNLDEPHSFWGMSDITPDYIGMNTALNLIMSIINRTNKLYGQPILFATGVAESVFDIQPGRIIGLPTDQSKIMAVNFTSDLTNALAFAESIRMSMDEQSAISAAMSTGKTMPRALSGITMELLFMPIIQKTEKKRCLYGKTIIDVSKALLVLAGYIQHVDEVDITLTWQAMLPNDDLQSAQTAMAKKSVGVSTETLLSELGYDADDEMERSQEEYQQELVNATRGRGLPPVSYLQPGQDPMAQQGGGQQ